MEVLAEVGRDLLVSADACLGERDHAVGARLSDELRTVEQRFDAVAHERLTIDDLVPEVRVDVVVPLSALNGDLETLLRHFEPHGVGNASPVFAILGARLATAPRLVGQGHLKLWLSHEDARIDAIGWGMGSLIPELENWPALDVAFRLERDEWNGQVRLQAKLLRVIQDGVVRRVGSEQQDAVVDVRFVSATNREPQEAVDAGVLRGDLFYRLRVVPIKLPPLRKRPEDIPLLANHFLTFYWHRHRQLGDRLPRLSEASVTFLRSRPWRGNVRELQNVIEHVAVLAEPDQVIQPNDIPVYDDGSDWPTENVAPPGVMDEAYHSAKDRVVVQFEKEYLTRLISRAGGNMSKAARLASIDRTTLYRLMDKHAFHRDETLGSAE